MLFKITTHFLVACKKLCILAQMHMLWFASDTLVSYWTGLFNFSTLFLLYYVATLHHI